MINPERLRRIAPIVVLIVLSAVIGTSASGRPLNQGAEPTLRIFAAEPTSGLDPATAVTQASLRVMELMYDTLLDYDQQGKLVPDLAQSWQAAPNGKSYTFRLRANAKFSDGSAVTAQDVKYSLDRAAKSESLKASLAVMRNVAVVNPTTVRVALRAPSRVFLNALARVGAAAILSQKAVEGNSSYFTKPTATSGPWTLAEWIPKDHLTLEANASYWRTGYPKIKTIQYTFSEDPTSAAAALESGTADMYYPMAPTDAIRLKKAGKINYYAPAQPGTLFWGFDKSKPPFNDVRVRQAVAYMVPRADRQKVCWEGTGGVSYGAVILPGSWAYTPGLTRFKVSKAGALQRAGKLLDAAGWKGSGVRKAQGVKGVKDGASLRVSVPFESNWDQARCNTQLLKAALQPLGVDIVPQAYDPASFWADVGKNKFTMYHGGDGWATVDDMMQQGLTTNGQANSIMSKWSNPEVDRLVAQAQATPSLAKAKLLYHRVQQIVLDQQPFVDTGAQYSIIGTTPKLHGYYGRADLANRSLITATLG
jgi:peptide/nickel transport system substrate-binding protein